jgi:hypothetical protein
MENTSKKSAATNSFEVAKQSIVINPKSVRTQAFVYRGMQDLENLIAFVGSSPKVSVEKGKIVLAFKKEVILDNRIILRNSYGEVTAVMTFEEAEKDFEILAQSEFLPEHKNKVEEKVRYIRKENRK